MKKHIPRIRLLPELGDDAVVARDGVAICFFLPHSHKEVAHAIWRALETYRRSIPPEALPWYVSNDGDYLPLDEKGWEQTRYTLLERPWGSAWIVQLEEDCSQVGGYNFEYVGRWLNDPEGLNRQGSATGVLFTLPTEYMVEHGPGHVRALALELARELPFSFGYASLALIAPQGRWFAARGAVEPLLWRYLGLDVYKLMETGACIGSQARGAYWLTFLGQPLLGQVGGEEGLRSKLAFPQVSVQPLEGERVLLTLGEWPKLLDTQKGETGPEYRALARVLEPYLYEERYDWFPRLPPAENSLRRWIRRLCQ
ncbi:type VI immunity family protein [Hyalangium minutum]|uniref:DUF3396 domain-containing protein n=1 Tax=Hyalangium minutum TaxID=394096 RepID=A0A085WJE2_9BACT|nr:type VI immunity family protein [Hyalangium minutum]KFE67805.1 hypothetical protein DB31_8288 [Hyalangium minutum]